MQMKKRWIWVAVAVIVVIAAIILNNVLRDDSYTFQQQRSNVVGVDIVYVEDLSHLTRGYYEGAAQPVFTVDESAWDAFFNGVAQLEVKSAADPPREGLSGELLRVTYEDGAFEIIGPYMYYYRNAQSHWSYDYHVIDQEALQNLINSLKN